MCALSLETSVHPLLFPQELANEKVQSQKLSNEDARLKQDLERAEAELKTVTADLLLSEKRERDAVPGNIPPESPANTQQATSSDTLTLEHPEAKDAQSKEGHDLLTTPKAGVEKTDWSLRERLIDLEREVCVHLSLLFDLFIFAVPYHMS